MDKHLQPLVLAQVECRVFIDCLRFAGRQIGHPHIQRLLVALHQLRLCGVELPRDAWRQHVVDGRLVAVLFYVHRTYGELTCLCGIFQVLLIHTPLSTNKVERCKAQHNGVLEAGEEHTHETDGGEVGDASLATFILREWYAELVPRHSARFAVAQRGVCLAFIHNKVSSHHHIFRAHRHAILIVFLIFVERVVLVDIFHIGHGLVRGVVSFRARLVVGRVALRIVDVLVSAHDRGLHLVEVCSAEIVIVVACGVVHDGVAHGGGHTALYLREEVLISVVLLLFGVGQSIVAHILQCTTAAAGGEGVSHGRLRRYLTPLREGISLRTIDGHTALVEFLSVAQHIFAHLAQIEVEVAAIFRSVGLLVGIDEGVHEPEFNVFHVGRFKVGGIELAHHSAPLLLRIVKLTLAIEHRVEVVGSALRWIVVQIEYGYGARGTIVTALVAVGEELAHIDFSHIVVAQLFQVALDVGRRER